MSEANRRTVAAYDDKADAYVAGAEASTPEPQRAWMDQVFAGIPTTASILEIGSAFGREATYLTERGYTVQTSDASGAFVHYLRAHGFEAQQLDIIEQKPDRTYDVIVAFAVFVHFTAEDLQKAMTHIAQSLSPGGLLAFSVIEGDGDKWSDHRLDVPRYFKYWQQDELDTIAAAVGLSLAHAQQANYGDKVWLLRTYRVQDAERKDI